MSVQGMRMPLSRCLSLIGYSRAGESGGFVDGDLGRRHRHERRGGGGGGGHLLHRFTFQAFNTMETLQASGFNLPGYCPPKWHIYYIVWKPYGIQYNPQVHSNEPVQIILRL